VRSTQLCPIRSSINDSDIVRVDPDFGFDVLHLTGRGSRLLAGAYALQIHSSLSASL